MLLFQILFTLFSLVILAIIVRRFSKQELSGRAAGFWGLIWMLGLIVVLQPQVASQLATLLGIGRGSDLILYVAIIVLFFMIFKVQISVEKMKISLARIVRHYALEDQEKEQKQTVQKKRRKPSRTA